MGGGVGGGGGGGGSSQMNPVGMEFGGPPNADVGSAPSPDLYNTNAMDTGTSGQAYSPATADYAQTPAATSTQTAEATPPPGGTTATAPGGVSSGGTGGGGLDQVLSMLVGRRGGGGAPSRDETAGLYASAAGRGNHPGVGWYTTPDRGAATDPYGNTYTTQPGYQASPMNPLPPYPPQQQPQAPARAPARAPAPAPPAPPRSAGGGDGGGGGGGGGRRGAAPAAAPPTPPPEPPPEAPATPEEITQQAAAPIGPPGTITAGRQAYPPVPYGPFGSELRGTIPGQDLVPGVPPQTAATAADYLRQNPPGTAPSDGTAPAAPVSPQSAPAPGNNIPGWLQTFLGPNTTRQVQQEIQSGSGLGKLLQGDFTGFINSLIGQQRAMNPNVASPEEVSRTLKGDFQGRPVTSPQNQPRRIQQPIQPNPIRTIRQRLTPAEVAPEAALARNAAQFSRPISIPGTRGMQRGAFPATIGNVRGVPVGPGAFGPFDPLTAAAPAGRGPGQEQRYPPRGAASAAGAQGRQPSYSEWLRARNEQPSNQNFIRYNNETRGAGLPGVRNQSVLPGQQDRRIWTDERGRLLNAPGQTGRYPTPGAGSLSPAEMDAIRQQGRIPDPRSPQQEIPPGAAGAGGLRNQAPPGWVPPSDNPYEPPPGLHPYPPPSGLTEEEQQTDFGAGWRDPVISGYVSPEEQMALRARTAETVMRRTPGLQTPPGAGGGEVPGNQGIGVVGGPGPWSPERVAPYRSQEREQRRTGQPVEPPVWFRQGFSKAAKPGELAGVGARPGELEKQRTDEKKARVAEDKKRREALRKLMEKSLRPPRPPQGAAGAQPLRLVPRQFEGVPPP